MHKSGAITSDRKIPFLVMRKSCVTDSSFEKDDKLPKMERHIVIYSVGEISKYFC